MNYNPKKYWYRSLYYGIAAHAVLGVAIAAALTFEGYILIAALVASAVLLVVFIAATLWILESVLGTRSLDNGQ